GGAYRVLYRYGSSVPASITTTEEQIPEEADDTGAYSMPGGHNRQELVDYVIEIRSIRATLQTGTKSQMAHFISR
ncbi:hypothetical protein BGW41_007209, partial [Actinomortierella wolfii]